MINYSKSRDINDLMNNNKRYIYRVLPTLKTFQKSIYTGIDTFNGAEYRGGLNIADDYMYVNIEKIRTEHKDTDIVYIAISKDKKSIYFEFSKKIFDDVIPNRFNLYTTTLKGFYTYLLAQRLSKLDTIPRVIVTNIYYLSYTVDEASKLLNIKESDLQQLISGMTIKTKLTDIDKIAATLGFSKEEYSPKYLQEALKPYEG